MSTHSLNEVEQIFVGTVSDLISEGLATFEEWSSSIGDDPIDDEYIFHIYSDGSIKVYPRLEGGTRLNFISIEDDTSTPENSSVTGGSYVLYPLYGIDKKQKERVWKTWVIGNTVYKAYGETGGQLITVKRSFDSVNVGDVDETTPEEQAKREAERDWVKQLDKNYYPKSKEGIDLADKVLKAKKKQNGVNANLDTILRGTAPEDENLEDNDDIEYDVIQPMHCQTWEDLPKCHKYFDFDSGVYIQPKLDGIRCVAQIRGNKVCMFTKSGKEMVWLNHLRDEIKLFLSESPEILLDGEIYADEIFGVTEYKGKKYTYSYDEENNVELDADQRFDVLSGGARPVRGEPHPLEGQFCYHIFDIVHPTDDLDQDDRFEILKRLFSSPITKRCPHIKRVDTKLIYYKEEIEDYHDEMSELNYEGVVIRSRDLYYEYKNRSLRMRKYKHFITEEYPIVDMLCDKGVDRADFRWVCEAIVDDENGEKIMKTFKAKPMGTREMRWAWYDNYEEHLGKLLTVKFQNYTYEGVPRFPRGVTIRDYE